jgi:hypothetical protein
MGQWKNYRCIAQDLVGEQTSGSTSAADFPKLRATGDANEGVTYTIVMSSGIGGAGTTDSFHYIKNEGKGNEETVYAGISGTYKFVHTINGTDLSGNYVYASIDEGVEIAIPNNNYSTGDKFKFTIPKLERVYDGGMHGFCQMAFLPGTTEGSGIIYTDDIPFKLAHTATFMCNAKALTYTISENDNTGNSGTDIDLQWSLDGTNYFDGFELINDSNLGDQLGAGIAIDRYNMTAVYDKDDAIGTPPEQTGGYSPKYRLKFQYQDLTGGEKELGRKQYLHVAIYNH